MEVVLIRWPEEAERRARARAEGSPRLLLVSADVDPPAIDDPLEDWVRIPAADRDVRARVRTLQTRAVRTVVPSVDDDGIVVLGTRWVALSPVEAELARVLAERFGAVVGRDVLMRRAWPDEPPSRNALDVHVLRLRRRLAPLGLEIRTVRSRGYLLQTVEPDDPAATVSYQSDT